MFSSPRPAHVGGAGVAEMGVVRPDDHLGRAMAGLEMGDEFDQGLHHVLVALVPGRDVGAEHFLIVLLRVFDEARVLLGEEKFIRRGAGRFWQGIRLPWRGGR